MNAPLPSLHPQWKRRLASAFDHILKFSEFDWDRQTSSRAESPDRRTILEFLSDEKGLIQSALSVGLRDADDLTNLKLSCWSLLFLKALFPEWVGVENWVQTTGAEALSRTVPLNIRLTDYQISCRYDATGATMRFDVIRVGAKASPPPRPGELR